MSIDENETRPRSRLARILRACVPTLRPRNKLPLGKAFVRQTIRLGVLLAGAYLLLSVAGCFFADRLMFQPPQAGYRDSASVIKLTTADGVTISAMYYENAAAQYTILYSHGNAEDLGTVGADLAYFHARGFSVLGYDYHGYGTSGGRPSEAHTYADIEAAWRYLTEQRKVPPDRIILYGRSIGGGPAVDLATRQQCAGLVLQSCFTSAYRAVLPIPLPGDRFRNLDKIGRVHCPVLVIHGRRDDVVRFEHGLKLFAAANEPKQCLWLDDAGHNDVMDACGEKVMAAMKDFVKLMDGERQRRPPEVAFVSAKRP